MNINRVLALIRRIVRQIALDRRTVALVILAPMLMLTLGSLLFRSETAPIQLGVVNDDEGISIPGGTLVSAGDLIIAALEAEDAFELSTVRVDEIDNLLRDGTIEGVVVFPSGFTSRFLQSGDKKLTIDLRLEGSDPARSTQITARVTQAAIAALNGLLTSPTQPHMSPGGGLPVEVQTSYLYPTQNLDVFDYFAPAYIAFLSFFFVFLLTCVAFLRERSQGTLERLLATPVNRSEIMAGYMGGLGLFALIQVAIILSFTIWVLKVHFLGSLVSLFIIIALLAFVGVTMGILASTFARNEFQVIQFIPIVIIPQALLCGMIWPIKDMPSFLQPFAYIMPLTYANRALDDIMLKGQGFSVIWPDLAIMAGFIIITLVLGTLSIRREVS